MDIISTKLTIKTHLLSLSERSKFLSPPCPTPLNVIGDMTALIGLGFEQFILASLKQLCGWVGRLGKPSLCRSERRMWDGGSNSRPWHVMGSHIASLTGTAAPSICSLYLTNMFHRGSDLRQMTTHISKVQKDLNLPKQSLRYKFLSGDKLSQFSYSAFLRYSYWLIGLHGHTIV